GRQSAATPCRARPTLRTLDLDDEELAKLFGGGWRHVERDGRTTLAFFAGANRHVVTRAKEIRVLRPHGAILRTGDRLEPRGAALPAPRGWGGGVPPTVAPSR